MNNTSDTNTTTEVTPTTQFSDFNLPKPLLKALDSLNFTTPTLVQEKTLDSALQGNDLMVSAKTGSGKTVAFLLPCLTHIINNQSAKNDRSKMARPQVLVICPTRELVQQVTQDAIKLVKYCKGLRVASVVGGMSYPKQIANLRGAQIVIATPGRLLDLEEGGNIGLDKVTHMVLDEADRMLDLGFSEDLAKIAKCCEQRQQTLLFSATFAKNIVGLAEKLMNNPQRIELANSQDKHTDISQSLYWANDQDHKQSLLLYWLENETIDQMVIFTPTKVETESLALALRKANYSVVDLHGGMRQFMRMKQIKKLRDGKAQILVATDVAARGLDVPTISHVINYGIPMKNEDYVHRIGRTGRAGKKGIAITVSTYNDRNKLFDLQKFLKQEIEVCEVEGLEPKPYIPRRKKKPSSRRRGSGSRSFSDDKSGNKSFKKRSYGKSDKGSDDGFSKSDKPFRKRRANSGNSDGHNFSAKKHEGKKFGKKDGFKGAKDGFKGKKSGFKKSKPRASYSR